MFVTKLLSACLNGSAPYAWAIFISCADAITRFFTYAPKHLFAHAPMQVAVERMASSHQPIGGSTLRSGPATPRMVATRLALAALHQQPFAAHATDVCAVLLQHPHTAPPRSPPSSAAMYQRDLEPSQLSSFSRRPWTTQPNTARPPHEVPQTSRSHPASPRMGSFTHRHGSSGRVDSSLGSLSARSRQFWHGPHGLHGPHGADSASPRPSLTPRSQQSCIPPCSPRIGTPRNGTGEPSFIHCYDVSDREQ